MTTQEIFAANQVLTVEIAKSLIGKRIQTVYSGYRGQDGDDNFVIGDVVSELEYYRNLKEECYENDPKFKNRAEYWESYMSEKQLSEAKSKMVLITADGRNTFIYAHSFNNGAFTCSDSDRFVYYVELPTYVRVNGCGNFDGWRLRIVNFVRRETEPTCGEPFNVFLCENPDGTIVEWSDNVFSYEN